VWPVTCCCCSCLKKECYEKEVLVVLVVEVVEVVEVAEWWNL
jgi:hypothetical protein